MKLIHANMTFIHGRIHQCRWIKITFNFKQQAQSSKLRFLIYAQAIFEGMCTQYCRTTDTNPHTIEVVQPIINNDKGFIL